LAASSGFQLYQEPVLGMLVHGSAAGSALPACSSSMEMPSGVRIKAIRPSRGGRLIVTPRAMNALQCRRCWETSASIRRLAFRHAGHLVFDQLRIKATLPQQLLVRAGFDHPAGIQHQDDVGCLDGR